MVKGRLPQAQGKRLVVAAVALYLVGLLAGYDRVPSVISWGVPSILLVCGVVSWEVKSGASALVQKIGTYGDSSYILYLSHKTLIFAMVAALQAVAPGQEINAVAFTMVATILCLTFGEFTHTYVEKPMLGFFKPKRQKRPSAITSAPQTNP